MQNDCINPDESLAEMLSSQRKIQQKIIKNFANGGNGSIENFQAANKILNDELTALKARIAKVEHAGRTGGIIRIM